MANPIKKLKRGIRKLLGKGSVKAIAKAKSSEEETERQKRLRVKYPQMYKPGGLAGTKGIMSKVRRMDPSSVSGVGKSRTRVLKKKYGGK